MNKLLALAGAAALALGGCQEDAATTDGNSVANESGAPAASTQTLREVTAGAGQFHEGLKAAGLEATLDGPGPYTVLVPGDAAFGKLPQSAVAGLKQPQAKSQLTAILTYHILPGTILVADLRKAIDNGKGKAVLATMAGSTLTATLTGDKIALTDQAGRKVTITGQEQIAKNGVAHAVDGLLMPTKELKLPS